MYPLTIKIADKTKSDHKKALLDFEMRRRVGAKLSVKVKTFFPTDLGSEGISPFYLQLKVVHDEVRVGLSLEHSRGYMADLKSSPFYVHRQMLLQYNTKVKRSVKMAQLLRGIWTSMDCKGDVMVWIDGMICVGVMMWFMWWYRWCDDRDNRGHSLDGDSPNHCYFALNLWVFKRRAFPPIQLSWNSRRLKFCLRRALARACRRPNSSLFPCDAILYFRPWSTCEYQSHFMSSSDSFFCGTSSSVSLSLSLAASVSEST